MDALCRKCTRCKTPLLPPLITCYCLLSNTFTRPKYAFRSYLNLDENATV
jgi:hypothetical protein